MSDDFSNLLAAMDTLNSVKFAIPVQLPLLDDPMYWSIYWDSQKKSSTYGQKNIFAVIFA